jgi:hypothetical protein
VNGEVGVRRNRVIVSEVDSRGQFRLDSPDVMDRIVCIGCGCDDRHPCPGGCSWVAVNDEVRVGLCSTCAHKPIDELLKI